MYHRRFEYRRYAKGLRADLSLAGSGAPPRPLAALAHEADFDAPDPSSSCGMLKYR
jgi:hypothetical protein